MLISKPSLIELWTYFCIFNATDMHRFPKIATKTPRKLCMPPKKAKKIEVDSVDLELLDKIAKANMELTAFQKELELKTMIIARNKLLIDTQRNEINSLKEQLEARHQDRIDLASGILSLLGHESAV